VLFISCRRWKRRIPYKPYQFNYINPLPYNVADIFSRFKKIIICELNLGQFALYLRSKLPDYNYLQFNKVQGLPFLISELKAKFKEILGKPEKQQ
jgi:2-oxoglutarate ferredoxin oxidoreductase subunit alpha